MRLFNVCFDLFYLFFSGILRGLLTSCPEVHCRSDCPEEILKAQQEVLERDYIFQCLQSDMEKIITVNHLNN